MTLFRVQVFKTQNSLRFWTNVYHIEGPDIEAVAAFSNIVLAVGEASLMDGSFIVSKTLVDDTTSNDFISTPLAIPGSLSGVSVLPLYNTVKVNVSVAGFGRNDYKFYRGGLTEAGQTNGVLETAVQDAYEDMVNAFIADATAAGLDMVDNAGNLWQVAETQPAVQMRQLHRRRRRVGEPA